MGQKYCLATGGTNSVYTSGATLGIYICDRNPGTFCCKTLRAGQTDSDRRSSYNGCLSGNPLTQCHVLVPC